MSDYESEGSTFSLDDIPVRPKAKVAAGKKTLAKKTIVSELNDYVTDSGNTSASGSRQNVEEIYQKKTPLEHILLRPDTYIGSVEPIEDEMWVMDMTTKRMVRRNLHYTPGLYKIVDEILVNAADNKVRDPSMRKIEVTLDKETGEISVKNDGKGIPVEIHKEEKVYVPEMIFGHLLTSSNYNDDQKKITGGRNGYGAKLCNIFSTEFIVETADSTIQKKYRQVFTDNMKTIKKPSITKFTSKTEYTKISFKPDFAKFHMTHLDDDTVALITRRVYDLAGTIPGIKVLLNGEVIPVRNFKSYVELYLLPPANSEEPGGTKSQDIVYKRFSDRWEVAFAVSEGQFNQVSFVNNINTVRGGTHVTYIADQIIKKFIASTKKNKISIKPHQVKNNMWIFVNSHITNPAFDSQTKETLTLRQSAFGSKCEVTDDFMKGVAKSDLNEMVEMMVRRREERDLKKTDGSRTSRITGIDKLDDANMAGTTKSKDCTLILTEGDSAKALAVAGLSVQGRDKFGIFTLRGKPLNVRDASARQIGDNQEFTNIKRIMGLKHGVKYTSVDQLRYGHILIMADQDVDGSHIKGLLLNMFDSMYPGLLEVSGFMQQFITPVVRATNNRNKNLIHDFYTEAEYKKWFDSEPNAAKNWTIKYYKGLGTSKAEDARKYFKKLEFHRKNFAPAQTEDRRLLDMAFNKKKADDRKEWLAAYQPGEWIDNNQTSVSVQEFINKELVLFSIDDNSRSIPSVVDGLKPGQRKILWTSLVNNIKSEIKVVSLQGKVTEKAAYHHGDQSLVATIVNMAQDYVGSNNINLLVPEGSFGTRLVGGKDAASARYISTYLSAITRSIFHKNDDSLLVNLNDDGKVVEPRWYIPVIPMVLVNGADGIGTGWSTSIPNYNPTDIINNIRRMMRGEEPEIMVPWYRGFRSSIERMGSDRFRTMGTIEKISDDQLQISELPIRVWTDTYKALLNTWMTNDKGPAMIKDFRNNSSTLTVDIILKLTPEQMQKAEAEGFDKRFKLSTTIATSNMVCFDREGRLRKYGSAEEIISDFYPLRLRYYQLRKEKLAEHLGRELQRADNRARFVLEIIQKKLVINNRKRVDIIKDLRDRDYTPIPKEVRIRVAGDLDSEEAADRAASEDASDYDYLLSMPIWNLTLEKVQKLLQEKGEIQLKLEQLLAKTPTDIWNEDLDIVEKQWNDMVAEYEKRLLDDEEDRRNQEGGKGKGKGRPRVRKATTTATTTAAAAKRKATTALIVDDDGAGPSQPPAKRVATVSNVSKTAARGRPKKIPDADTAMVTETKPMVTETKPVVVNLGSDLEDSDDESANLILKRVAAKSKLGTGRKITLSDMFAKKKAPAPVSAAETATVASTSASASRTSPAPRVSSPSATLPVTVKPTVAPKKRGLKQSKIIDSDDDEDNEVFRDGNDESDDEPISPIKPRARAARGRAAASKPVYVDISDEDGRDDDGDESDHFDDDDDEDFEMD